MSLISESFDSLPYIDQEPTAEQRAQIEALLQSKVKATEHPRLPPLREPNFSPFIVAELERVAASEPLQAIDTSRYEELSIPEAQSEENLAKLKATLRAAYTTHTHLSVRQTNLELLEKHGKNAWLLGNYHIEQELKALEKELAETNEAVEVVNRERKQAQEAKGPEMQALNQKWKEGVEKILQIEMATEALKSEINEAKKSGK